MKIGVVGKGGGGKTTVARALGREGVSVLAVDADVNPMLGISLGVGPQRTEALVGTRQALDAGEAEHQPSADGIIDAFGADAPDGRSSRGHLAHRPLRPQLRLMRAIDRAVARGDRGRRPIRGLRHGGRARHGLATQAGQLDVVLVIAEPIAKGIDVARHAAQIAGIRARVIVVANRIAGAVDLEAVREALPGHELAVPEEPAIVRADREGIAPIDMGADAPGVEALCRLAQSLR